jgi:ribosomal protein L24E
MKAGILVLVAIFVVVGAGCGGDASGGGGGGTNCPADPANAVMIQLANGQQKVLGDGSTLYLDSPAAGTAGSAGTIHNCPNSDNGIALDTGFNVDLGGNFVEPVFPMNTTTTNTCNGANFPPGTYKMAIRNVGPVCGLGAISASMSPGSGTTTLAVAGDGYVFTTPDQQVHRMYVSKITPNTVGGSYGPLVIVAP